MLTFFEKLVDPYADHGAGREVPRKLIPFLLEYLRPFRKVAVLIVFFTAIVAAMEVGASVGGGIQMKTVMAPLGVGIETNIVDFGLSGGSSYSHSSPDVTVSRSSSRHFDVGISFSTAISTSDSPHLPGQPSDIIVGGGANLRFISAIEIFAKANDDGLCLGGQTTQQFLPEQISTWVMSVYEIEKLMERLGAALTDPNTKIEKKNASDTSIPDPRDDLVQQIENWQTVLRDYRATTVRDQAESVADQLTKELNSIHASFKGFLADTTTGGSERDQFSDFLSHGLNKLEENGGDRISYHAPRDNVDKAPGGSEASEKAHKMATVAGRSRTDLYENHALIAVNSAYTECVDKVALVEPDREARLCDVYRDISANLELKSSLFGICDFAKEDTGRPKEQNTKGTPGDHCCPFDKSYCTGDSDKDARTRVLENLNFFARLRESRRACPEGSALRDERACWCGRGSGCIVPESEGARSAESRAPKSER